MNVLVTGCAGFIGSRVAALLLDQGHDVVGIDNMNDAYDVRLKDWRLAQLDGSPHFQFYRLDITGRSSVNSLFSNPGNPINPIDAVINLAARAGVRQSVKDPWAYYQTNVFGTLNLLNAIREHRVSKFVQASTSSVYGNTPRPFREDAITDRPLSPYAASKKAAEELCYNYHHLYGMDITVLRFFTVYGPAGRPDMSIFRFIKWIDAGEPVTVYGDGTQERDFTYVDDIARGAVAALGHPNKPNGRDGRVFEVVNLGSDRPVALRYIVERLEGLLGKKAVVKHEPMPSADVMATWADIDQARALLGWRPCTRVEEGLNSTVEWYLENRSWASSIAL